MATLTIEFDGDQAIDAARQLANWLEGNSGEAFRSMSAEVSVTDIDDERPEGAWMSFEAQRL